MVSVFHNVRQSAGLFYRKRNRYERDDQFIIWQIYSLCSWWMRRTCLCMLRGAVRQTTNTNSLFSPGFFSAFFSADQLFVYSASGSGAIGLALMPNDDTLISRIFLLIFIAEMVFDCYFLCSLATNCNRCIDSGLNFVTLQFEMTHFRKWIEIYVANETMNCSETEMIFGRMCMNEFEFWFWLFQSIPLAYVSTHWGQHKLPLRLFPSL